MRSRSAVAARCRASRPDGSTSFWSSASRDGSGFANRPDLPVAARARSRHHRYGSDQRLGRRRLETRGQRCGDFIDQASRATPAAHAPRVGRDRRTNRSRLDDPRTAEQSTSDDAPRDNDAKDDQLHAEEQQRNDDRRDDYSSEDDRERGYEVLRVADGGCRQRFSGRFTSANRLPARTAARDPATTDAPFSSVRRRSRSRPEGRGRAHAAHHDAGVAQVVFPRSPCRSAGAIAHPLRVAAPLRSWSQLTSVVSPPAASALARCTAS